MGPGRRHRLRRDRGRRAVHLPLRVAGPGLPADPADAVLRDFNEPVVARKRAAAEIGNAAMSDSDTSASISNLTGLNRIY